MEQSDTGHVTYRGDEVPGGQSKVLGHPYWLSVPTRGGHVQQGALGNEVVACKHLYRGTYIQVIITSLSSPVGSEIHSCKELMFHCTAC